MDTSSQPPQQAFQSPFPNHRRDCSPYFNNNNNNNVQTIAQNQQQYQQYSGSAAVGTNQIAQYDNHRSNNFFGKPTNEPAVSTSFSNVLMNKPSMNSNGQGQQVQSLGYQQQGIDNQSQRQPNSISPFGRFNNNNISDNSKFLNQPNQLQQMQQQYQPMPNQQQFQIPQTQINEQQQQISSLQQYQQKSINPYQQEYQLQLKQSEHHLAQQQQQQQKQLQWPQMSQQQQNQQYLQPQSASGLSTNNSSVTNPKWSDKSPVRFGINRTSSSMTEQSTLDVPKQNNSIKGNLQTSYNPSTNMPSNQEQIKPISSVKVPLEFNYRMKSNSFYTPSGDYNNSQPTQNGLNCEPQEAYQQNNQALNPLININKADNSSKSHQKNNFRWISNKNPFQYPNKTNQSESIGNPIKTCDQITDTNAQSSNQNINNNASYFEQQQEKIQAQQGQIPLQRNRIQSQYSNPTQGYLNIPQDRNNNWNQQQNSFQNAHSNMHQQPFSQSNYNQLNNQIPISSTSAAVNHQQQIQQFQKVQQQQLMNLNNNPNYQKQPQQTQNKCQLISAQDNNSNSLQDNSKSNQHKLLPRSSKPIQTTTINESQEPARMTQVNNHQNTNQQRGQAGFSRVLTNNEQQQQKQQQNITPPKTEPIRSKSAMPSQRVPSCIYCQTAMPKGTTDSTWKCECGRVFQIK